MDICPSGFKATFNKLTKNVPEIRLGDDSQSAALVHQSWNSSTFKRFNECHFSVNANDLSKNKERGLYVSIRKLNLRKAIKDETCIDFISFKFSSNEQKKYCGRLTTSTDDLQKSFFIEPRGLVKVKILFDTFRPLKYVEDTLDIEVLFTAFEGELTNTQQNQS